MVYLSLSQALRKAFLFPANARQSVYASGACDKELETTGWRAFALETTMKKKCLTCNQIKSISEFHKDRSRQDGLDPRCKDCERERAKGWRESNPDYGKNRWAENKEHMSETHREWRAANPENARERMRRYRTNSPEKAKVVDRRWYANHKDKSLKKSANYRAKKRGSGGKITVKEWNWLKEYYNYTCLCCGRKEPEIKLALDHVVPLAAGGKNTIDNAQPLCTSCNCRKQARHIDYRPIRKLL